VVVQLDGDSPDNNDNQSNHSSQGNYGNQNDHGKQGSLRITHMGIAYPVTSGTEMYVGLHVKYPLLWSNLNQNWNVLTNFSKTPQYQI
jgi:hypothetical protein